MEYPERTERSEVSEWKGRREGENLSLIYFFGIEKKEKNRESKE